MTDFATLLLTADASGLKQGEAALDSIAAKGAQTEQRVGSSMKKIRDEAKKAGESIKRDFAPALGLGIAPVRKFDELGLAFPKI
ncbi:hypothetical protein, partial [Paracoccus sp. (in: a-proteobacteria)]|uniref:hypothetical protein n=1 Tax=Paracoccus sp. TaxID=267 RepID=UPI0028A81337